MNLRRIQFDLWQLGRKEHLSLGDFGWVYSPLGTPSEISKPIQSGHGDAFCNPSTWRVEAEGS